MQCGARVLFKALSVLALALFALHVMPRLPLLRPCGYGCTRRYLAIKTEESGPIMIKHVLAAADKIWAQLRPMLSIKYDAAAVKECEFFVRLFEYNAASLSPEG